MRESDENVASRSDPDVAETVVLDRDNTPARLLVDEPDFLHPDGKCPSPTREFEQEPDAEDAGETAAAPPRRHRRGLASAALALARKPENLLVRAYLKSGVRHRLRSRYEWYRDMEGDQALANKLQNVYGGSNNPVRNLIHFARNNALITLVCAAASVYLFSDWLSEPVVARYGKPRLTAQAVAEPSSAAAGNADAASPARLLDHCSVTDNLRATLVYIDDPAQRERLIAEMSGFVRVYANSEIEQWYAQQELKRKMVVNHIRATLPRVHAYRQQVAREISDMERRYAELLAQLNAAATPSPNLADINRSIRLRTRLAGVEAQMKDGPSASGLDRLDRYLDRLEKIMAGDLTVQKSVVSYWAIQASEQNEESLANSVKNIIQKDIYATTEQASQGAPEARSYRLAILAATLRHFGDLIGQLQSSNNLYEAQVGVQQSETNDRIRQLLGSRATPDAQFLDYGACLTDSAQREPTAPSAG